MANPSRLSNGLNTQDATDALSIYPLPDPARTSGSPLKRVHTYFNDFETLPTTEYTVSGTGTPAFALTAGQGGLAALTTTVGASDSALIVKATAGFGFASGYKAWFASAFKLSEVTNNTFVIGMIDTTSNQNGIIFSKATGGASVNVVAIAAGVSTTLATGVATLVANTMTELALQYDGTDLLISVNNAVVARVPNLSMAVTGLTPTVQLTNSTGVIRTATIDYIFAAEEADRAVNSSIYNIGGF